MQSSICTTNTWSVIFPVVAGSCFTLTVTSYGTSMMSSPPKEGPQTKPKSFSAVPYSKSASIGIGNRANPNIRNASPRNINTFQRDFFNDSFREDKVCIESFSSTSPTSDSSDSNGPISSSSDDSSWSDMTLRS